MMTSSYINKISKDCVVCGKEFFLINSLYERYVCCSKDCGYKYRKRYIGNTNPAWKGGWLKSNKSLYRKWQGMKQRCLNPNHPSYYRYGGRGIKVCDRWCNFENFVRDMAPSYSQGLTLERINNDKGYSPDNCKWATPKEQANNRGTNRIINFNKRSMTLSQWAELTGIRQNTITMRINKYGWSLEKALTTPVSKG